MGFTGAHMLYYVLDIFILALYLLSHVCALLEYTFKLLKEGRERDEKSLFRRLLPRRFMSIRGFRGSSGILIGTKGRKIEALTGSVTF